MATDNNQELEKHIMLLLSQTVNSNDVVLDRISKLVAFIVKFASKLNKVKEIDFENMPIDEQVEFIFNISPKIYSSLVSINLIPESFQDEAKQFFEMHDKFRDKIKVSLEIYELTANITGLPTMEENVGVIRRVLRRFFCVRIPRLCRNI